jgi:hypothetical protein
MYASIIYNNTCQGGLWWNCGRDRGIWYQFCRGQGWWQSVWC